MAYTAAEHAQRGWPCVIGLGTAAASLCVALVEVGVIIGRGNDTGSSHATAPLTAIEGEALDGSYRVDVNREQQTYNGSPDRRPPNVNTWWAFRTACAPNPAWPPGVEVPCLPSDTPREPPPTAHPG